MCRFCERNGNKIKKIIVCKYEEKQIVYDGVLGCVQNGIKTIKKQPNIKLETDKGYIVMSMPIEFLYCPHCGRKINNCEV